MFLIYDTETTGLPKDFNAPVTDTDNWPRMVQIAWQLHDKTGKLIENKNYIVRPDGYDIPFNAAQIHGITTEKAIKEGIPLQTVLDEFRKALQQSEVLGGHNLSFDQGIVGAEFVRSELDYHEIDLPIVDTMELSTEFCALPGGRGGRFKSPKLEELHEVLFKEKFDEAHNAAADVNATARSFMELLRIGVFKKEQVLLSEEEFEAFKEINSGPFQPFDIVIEDQVKSHQNTNDGQNLALNKTAKSTTDAPFFHFHNHTSFSILTATTSVDALVQKAIEEKMPAVGITDMGNLMGAFKFVSAVKRANSSLENPIKPIIGCEVYVSENYTQNKFTKDNPDRRFTQLLIAKNKAGFKNLSKISSTGFIDGYYAGFPRVGKNVIEEYKENLIATTGSLTGEVPNLILNVGENQAEEAFVYWHNLFGEDFYVEIIRHGLPEEEHVNQVLIKFAEKYNVKVLAQNNTFYIGQADAEAHDILLCVRDGEKKNTPIGRGRGTRFGFPNDEFYFKSQDQMRSLFHDIPESIDNLSELLDKIEPYELASDVLLPKFAIPEEFKDAADEADNGTRGEMAYLRHITYVGAEKRYREITPDIKERLDFELDTIERTGYPGYFLIVQDFTSQARKMGVSVGPGRGSAAGSAVAYCIGITNVDPIAYNLLFERFLNPDRVSLPDIDIDFDDRGRDKIIQWVVDKYGKSQVAQIITYGTMAGKSAIRDTGRVLDLPLPDTDRIAKKTHLKLNKLFNMDEKALKSAFGSDEFNDSMELKKIREQDTLEAKTLQQATVIEGSLRNTGIHACGVIITPKDIRELVPVAVAKDAELLVTQFDNSVVESAGLLKMDFLGLRTLTIINDAIDLIEKNHGVKINPDEIPLDDKKTYELFQRAETIAIFQYESPGMQKHMKALKPDKFDDLIAMNALYRPGPLQYIPNFINRKHGIEEIVYDLPEMEEHLAETYGITVYQEQVMLLSQKLANFTKGEADVLRKAMGKKQRDVLDKMKPKFLEGGEANNHPKKVLEKVWNDWEAFAEYAFNKSHSTCYALIGYHTGYLKAHYPAEFMAAVLSNNMSNIKSVTFFMEECKSLGIPVLGPDVNESSFAFSVNDEGAIRFGMGAIKGVGGAAVESILGEREENGKFATIFDFVQRVDLRQANKKTIENLALAGAFDEFEIHRAQFFYDEDGSSNLEKLIRYGASFQDSKNSAQASLFGDLAEEIEIIKPHLPTCQPWNSIQKLNREKEVVGIYISSHPLNDYLDEFNFYQNTSLKQLKENQEKLIGRELSVAGIITDAQHKTSNKDGREFGVFTLEDFDDSYEFMLFGEDYLKFKHFLQPNMMLGAKISVTERVFKDKDGKVTGRRIYVNINKMQLLSEILEGIAKKVVITVNVADLTKEIYEELVKIFEKHKGEKSVLFVMNDLENKTQLKLPATKTKVEISKELLTELRELPNLVFQLN
ncbi:DNA polymerase III subunit alpha [Moheibacter lacus]|uniref:DNA polymerase III subunit alpha n=1 Tax=Moheibacter lacus TaxID=2745851 RepID=A0A838ZMZ8_9FLAO|nr:DNA polymerase III subunit alpha [Moheibacter lacus]MBA5628996.1 DNA polymerase III subunit alpha [Moheibacter lacus]